MTKHGADHHRLILHVLERAGCPLHYWVAGPETAPLVVLMHGAALDHRLFNAQVDALVPRYRVLVWDARGHGQSRPVGAGVSVGVCADDLSAVLDDLGVKQAVIGGHSFGGFIAQVFQARAPERVLAMVIIGSMPLGKPYPALTRGLGTALPLFDRLPYPVLTRLMAHGAGSTQATRGYALHAMRQVDQRDFVRIWKAVRQAIGERHRPVLDPAPALLVLQGEHDGLRLIPRARWECAGRPGANCFIVPRAGHNANQDNPQFTNRVMLNFLDRQTGGLDSGPLGYDSSTAQALASRWRVQ